MARPLFEQYKDALRRGHVALLNDELEAALRAYREAAALVPDRPLPWASIGGVLERLDRANEALRSYDQALVLAPEDPAIAEARAALAAAAPADAPGPKVATADPVARETPPAAQPPDAGHPGGEPAAPESVDAAAAEAAAAAVAVEASRREAADRIEAEKRAQADKRREADRAARLEKQLATEAAAMDAMRAALDPRADDEASPATGGGGGSASGDEPAATPTDVDAEPKSFYVERAPDVVMDEERNWPAIDLPSLPPEPFVGPPPDPGTIQAEADALVDSGDLDGARDLLLVSVAVHRDAGRLDAALDASLQLLAVAPGDPRVHLAIANLQLDRGWRSVATEKIELLLRLTSLNGDAQAEADVHLLAADRLRDEDPARLDARRRGLPTP